MMMLIAWTMRKSRYDEAKGGENKRRRLVKSFSAIESTTKIFVFQLWNSSFLK